MLTLLQKLNFSNLMLCILHGRNPQSAFPYRTPQRHFIVKKKNNNYTTFNWYWENNALSVQLFEVFSVKKENSNMQINQLL